ncbi:MAG TPA: hypothetical protein VEW48_10715 [Thermoanaerobaculia bacterium]|nr:hypothetical protein [Thermoanaerobaculia bacterium]
MKKTTILLAAFAMSCLAGPAMSTESAHLLGASSPTAFSGRTGAEKTLSKPASENDAIFAVEVSERSDDPCFLKARYRDVVTGAEEGSLRFARCSDNNDNEGNNSSRATVILPDGSFVTGVRICLSSDRDKLKGIQLLGRVGGCLLGEESIPVSSSPCSGMVHLGGMEYTVCNETQPTFRELGCEEPSATLSRFMERTNCKGSERGPDQDWESEVSCPAGMVATGMRLSTRDSGGGRAMIDGIALDCTRLTIGGSSGSRP